MRPSAGQKRSRQRAIEIGNRLLQFLEFVLMLLAVARHVGHAPMHGGVAFGRESGRTRTRYQP